MRPLAFIVLVVLGLAVAATLFDSFVTFVTDTRNANEPPPPYPEDQRHFILSKEAAAERFNKAPNDIVRDQMKREWRKLICSMPAGLHFKSLLGRVKTVGANIVGYGGVTVDIGGSMEMSDVAQPGTPIYEQMATLREGQEVWVSGVFESSSFPECGVSIMGSRVFGDTIITNPEFPVEFTRLSVRW